MELKPVYKTVETKGSAATTVTCFSLAETVKKYANETVKVGNETFPLRVTVSRKIVSRDKDLYVNMQEEVIFYYIDPVDATKIHIVKKEAVDRCKTIISK